MYWIGDNVLYGAHGVCRIVDKEERTVDKKSVEYFVLEPLNQSGARFLVPSQNSAALAKLRPIMTKEEIDALLCSPEIATDVWIVDENQRKQCYRTLITSGDGTGLLRMVKTLYRHKQEQLTAGKRLHLCDENFLRDAQKLLDSEFSLVLGLEPDMVKDYLLSHMNTEDIIPE